MPRKSLRPNLNQIRTWVRQGRTDAWIAHQLDVSVRDIEQFKRQNDLMSEEELAEGPSPADYEEEVDLRAEDDALIAAELEAAELEAERAREEAERRGADERAEAEGEDVEDAEDAGTRARPRRRRGVPGPWARGGLAAGPGRGPGRAPPLMPRRAGLPRSARRAACAARPPAPRSRPPGARRGPAAPIAAAARPAATGRSRSRTT